MNATRPESRHVRLLVRARPALLATVAALTLAAGGGASAATVLSAGWNSSCGASTCFDSQGTYSVTFSPSTFSGPVDISKLLLSRSVLGSLDSHFISVSFMLNGHQIGSWGNWNMSSVAGDEFSLTGSDLIWNPADGDLVLVLDLVAPNGEKLRPDGHGGWYLPSGGGSAAAPVLPDDGQGGDPGFGDGFGDGSVTTFIPFPPPGDEPNGDGPPASGARGTDPVPEPGVWALMLGGFGLAGLALRRRKTAASPA